ncbi:alpha/beta hydrolase [Leptospira adleri]|uniref:Alpha/beta hydrolase n=1 Tax=Leptospira adleri TaxID=2023186 RepID=A0A2M9YTI8_9LEPT|nr:alpha/beta fold hydrolase [Leptospira adleri]PJZ54834.1 alpha/beta hydrolase [Leptospira adleri]PJZ61988.1 alpha/beta hydrolase [Leptospira adleri]
MKNRTLTSNPKNISKRLQIPIGDSQVIAAEVYGVFPFSKNSPAPVICIHGLTGNLMNFAPLARDLVKQGLTVITYDLRGRGESSKPSITYSHDLHSNDLLKIADFLKIEKANLLAHSLGCWISLTFAKKFPQRTGKLCLIDGGGQLSIPRKISNLLMIQESLQRLGKIFSSKEEYLALAKKSPILSSWNQDVANFLIYELEPVQEGKNISFRCNIPEQVVDSELIQMGGARNPKRIFTNFLKSPIQSVRILRKNRVLPYSQISAPALIIRAGKPNFKKGDELLPDSAIAIFQRFWKNAVFLTLPDKNHYEAILLPDLKRDETIAWFFSKT